MGVRVVLLHCELAECGGNSKDAQHCPVLPETQRIAQYYYLYQLIENVMTTLVYSLVELGSFSQS
jgi:hypothetical protein